MPRKKTTSLSDDPGSDHPDHHHHHGYGNHSDKHRKLKRYQSYDAHTAPSVPDTPGAESDIDPVYEMLKRLGGRKSESDLHASLTEEPEEIDPNSVRYVFVTY